MACVILRQVFMRRELLLYGLAGTLVIAVAYAYFHQRDIHARYVELRENEKQLEAVRRDVDALKSRVEETKARVENMEKDPVEMEATIRRIRRLTREGEIIFRIEEEESFWSEMMQPSLPDAPLETPELTPIIPDE